MQRLALDERSGGPTVLHRTWYDLNSFAIAESPWLLQFMT